ncbi:helix-turn-helix transcriptional regulator [Cystobacter fuscus]|uniref:hypothetical protein n=1 Tax=Cystobacter fuscus TaxID=43 RepID=UPI002B316553|nr:helix-turn-helix transcriptional regulator [Cystobacter fuscus]
MHPIYPSYSVIDEPLDFEWLCIQLLGAVWKLDFQPHGKQRDGQLEHGVDAYAEDDKRQWVGIQAKVRKTPAGLRKSDIKKAVDAAKQFLPKLRKYFIVTTVPLNKKLQAYARSMSEENAAAGLFSVRIIFWEEMQQYLKRHPEVAQVFYRVQQRDYPLSAVGDCPRFLAGKRLRKLRDDMKLSAGEFVQLCGLESELLLKKMEEEEADCGSSFLHRVAELTGASIDWLKYEKGSPYRTEYVYVDFSQKELIQLERAHEEGKIESLTATISAELKYVGLICQMRGSKNHRTILTNLRLDFNEWLVPLENHYLRHAHCFLLRIRAMRPWTWRPSEAEHNAVYYGNVYPGSLAFNALQPYRMEWRDWLEDFICEPLDYSDFSPERDRRRYGEWFVEARRTLSQIPHHQCGHGHAFSRRL